MKLFIIIPFTIVLIFFIISLRNRVFIELKLPIRFILVLCSLVPIWGVVLAFFSIIYFFRDVKNANSKNRIFRNSKINLFLFGKEKCEKGV